MRQYLVVFSVLMAWGLPMAAGIQTRVIDQNREPLAGVSAALLQLPDSTLVSFTMSDADGLVAFDREPSQGLSIRFSCTGYGTLDINTLDLGDAVVMTVKDTELQGVEVIGKSLVTYENDKLTYIPAGADLKVANTFELMRFTPMISMRNNEIYMLGDNDKPVRNILINGRQSLWDRGTVIQYLRSIPTENIIRIEVVPDGTYLFRTQGSTVNFVLRETTDGFMGNVDGELSYYHRRLSEDASMLFAYKNRGFSATGNFKFSNSRSLGEQTLTSLFPVEGTKVVNEERSDSRYTPISGNLNLNYDLTYRSTLAASFSINDKFDKNVSRDSEQYFTGATIDSTALSLNTDITRMGHPDWKIVARYNYNTDSRGGGLQVSAYYTRRGMRDPYNNLNYTIFSPDGMALQATDYNQVKQEKGYGIGGGVGYIHNFGMSGAIFVYYGINHASFNTYNTREYLIPAGGYEVNPQYTDLFDYSENIHNINVGGFYRINNMFSINAALRGSVTDVDGNQKTMADGKFTQNYFNLCPQISFGAVTPNGLHQLSVGYGSAVSRPSMSMLNPFISWSSPTTGTGGNPKATRQQYHSVSMYYNFLRSYNIVLRGSIFPDDLTFVKIQDGENRTITIFDNVGLMQLVSLEAGMTKSFFNGWWNIKVDAGISYSHNKGKDEFSGYKSHGWTWNISTGHTVHLSMKHDWYATANIAYNSGMIALGQNAKSSWYSNISLNKGFDFGGNLTLTVSGLIKMRNYRYAETPTYCYYNDQHIPAWPGISIGYSQTFGNMRVKKAKDVSGDAMNRF